MSVLKTFYHNLNKTVKYATCLTLNGKWGYDYCVQSTYKFNILETWYKAVQKNVCSSFTVSRLPVHLHHIFLFSYKHDTCPYAYILIRADKYIIFMSSCLGLFQNVRNYISRCTWSRNGFEKQLQIFLKTPCI